MLGTLVQTSSVSCTNDQYDRSNIDVINYLANWLDGLGMTTQVQEVAGTPGKANLIATAGSPSSDDPNAAASGSASHLPSPTQTIAFMVSALAT